MVLQTHLTKILNIKHPIIQGGMHYVGYAQMAAAVSNAGGLGMVTALTLPTPDELRQEIRKCKELTKAPFGVNLTILPTLKAPNYDRYVDVVLEENIPVVETAGNRLDEYWQRLKKEGVTIIHKCTAIRHARTAERCGVDMISLDGFECAGHPGEDDIGNYVLQALGARKLGIPFVCSGGVATGRQLAAALALGAVGVNMGTRFIATKEAPVLQAVKDALVEADEKSTTLVMRSLRNTERVFKNSCALEIQEIEKRYPGQFDRIAHLVKGENYKRTFHETGDVQSSIWSVGTAMGLIEEVPTCRDLLEGMVKEAEESIAQLSTCVKDDE